MTTDLCVPFFKLKILVGFLCVKNFNILFCLPNVQKSAYRLRWFDQYSPQPSTESLGKESS